jgi:ABC-type taurine transport system ATPase subunit
MEILDAIFFDTLLVVLESAPARVTKVTKWLG